jgi:release factor family 2
MDLSFLRPLYGHIGGWASVYLDASRDTEDAAKAVHLRWRAARTQLEADGCGPATLDALERGVLEAPPHPGRYGLALFARDANVDLTDVLADPPRQELGHYGVLPHVMPLVVQHGERVPWVRVVVDHTGADVLGMTAGGAPRSRQVAGQHRYPIHKAAPGGWSQPRYQRAAETSWERNAAEAASAVAQLADATGAEILIVAGDPRARPLLIEHLPRRWQRRVVETDTGSRAPGADPEPLDEVTYVAVVEGAEQRVADLIDRFETQLAHDAAAGTGLRAVVAGLQRSQVDTVLLVDDPSSTAELWVGPEPLELSCDHDELVAMNVPNPERARADAAIVRALACTDAELVVVQPEEVALKGGIGALLRYADPATRHE